ncbi:hypothetical protein ABTN36_18855, partial [Acinetobacter baumannii]
RERVRVISGLRRLIGRAIPTKAELARKLGRLGRVSRAPGLGARWTGRTSFEAQINFTVRAPRVGDDQEHPEK